MERRKMLMLVVRFHSLIALDPLVYVLRWSFEGLLTGRMPTEDHEGNTLTG